MDKSFLEQKKSRVNARLRDELGGAAGPYLVGTRGRKPAKYGLFDLEPSQICLRGTGRRAKVAGNYL
ncbi:MAG: hypothetical protein L0H73_05905 [Nitrococcus sp.]|nr:hypothetical protein [Nitrococcus sp.]